MNNKKSKTFTGRGEGYWYIKTPPLYLLSLTTFHDKKTFTFSVHTPEERSMLNRMRANVVSKILFIFISETVSIINGFLTKKGLFIKSNKVFFITALIR